MKIREEDNWRGGGVKKSSSAMFEWVFFEMPRLRLINRSMKMTECDKKYWKMNTTHNKHEWSDWVRASTTACNNKPSNNIRFFFIWSVGDVIGHNLFIIVVILSTVIHTDEYIWLSVTYQVGFFCWSKGIELDEVYWRRIFDSNL